MALIGSPVSAQEFRIGVIDFYGLHKLSAEQLRPHLEFSEGDVFSFDDEKSHAAFKQTDRQLSSLPGVRSARSGPLCCSNGQVVVFIGIEETGAPRWRFRKPPRGEARLPAEVAKAGTEFADAAFAAVARGDNGEDTSAGHSLFQAPEPRAIQLRFVDYAQRYLPVLREVLRQSSDANQRALAAQVIAYAGDKQAVVPDLVWAMRDDSADVRNDATRALLVFTKRESTPPLKIPYGPFVALLGSPVWTDRNKSSFAVESFTRTRDPKLLRLLRRQALGPLTEMARWKVPGYALPSVSILGRIAGYSEEEITVAIENARQEELIAAAASGRRQAVGNSR